MNDQPGFAAAMAELETILEEIESEAVDVDVLADRVKRASELIRLCRSRIADARMEVERVVAQLEGDDTQPE
jgi:exodeoxyribonuclease VII small subunit